jgi:L-alanine-DL-glutamate epimerase-like enolase superfamily enzyme
VEYQFNTVAAGDLFYGKKPTQIDGMMTMSDLPGFGLTPNADVLKTARDNG